MNCLCLTTNIDRPSTRYRLLQYIPYLSREGIDVRVEVIPRGMSRWKVTRGAGSYSGLFIQKKLFSCLEMRYLRSKARKIIYDFDDAVMYGARPGSIFTKRRRYKRFQYMAKGADLIVCGNKYLASKVEKGYSGKVVIVPTVVDVSKYPVKDYSQARGQVTLGWIGTGSTLGYLKMIAPVLERLSGRYPQLRVKVVSDRKPDIQGPYINYRRWEKDRELEELLGFDIGLMPLPGNPWTEGKCGFKLIQYMAVGIPVVCSPVGVNTEIVVHRVNGFCAESDKSWEKYISMLIEDAGLRKELGLAGRSFAENNYNLAYWGPYMAGLLRGALEG